jgi:hypothetical protein
MAIRGKGGSGERLTRPGQRIPATPGQRARVPRSSFIQVRSSRWLAGIYFIRPLTTCAPCAVRDQDGRLEVFGLDAAGDLFHTWQTVPGTGWVGDA